MSRESKRLVKGFGITEVVLVVVIVALIVGIVGYIKYVNNAAGNTYDQADASASSIVAEPASYVKNETCTLGAPQGHIAQIANNALEFCLPNGWSLSSSSSKQYFGDAKNLVYDASKKPRIGGSDIATSLPDLLLNYQLANSFNNKGDGVKLSKYSVIAAPKLSNGAGITVSAYYHLVTASDVSTAAFSGAKQGTKLYRYVITMPASDPSKSTVLEIGYNDEQGEANLLPLVQQLVSSVHMPAGMQM